MYAPGNIAGQAGEGGDGLCGMRGFPAEVLVGVIAAIWGFVRVRPIYLCEQ